MIYEAVLFFYLSSALSVKAQGVFFFLEISESIQIELEFGAGVPSGLQDPAEDGRRLQECVV